MAYIKTKGIKMANNKQKPAMDKRTWVNIAAGTIAVLAIVFGVKQCSDKQVAREEAQGWHARVNQNNETLTDARNALSACEGKIKDLTDELADREDVIAGQDSLILQLRDSLAVCREGQACPCTKGAKCNCKPACPSCKKKPARTTRPVRTTRPSRPTTTQPTTPVVEQKPVETVSVVSHKDSVVVTATATQKPDQAVIVNGDNNGVVIVNSNGVVNANGNVNGHDNNVDTQKPKRRVQGCVTTTTVVLGTRSKCY